MICDTGDVFWLRNLISGEEKLSFFSTDGEYKLTNKSTYLPTKMETLIASLDSARKLYHNIMLWLRKAIAQSHKYCLSTP